MKIIKNLSSIAFSDNSSIANAWLEITSKNYTEPNVLKKVIENQIIWENSF